MTPSAAVASACNVERAPRLFRIAVFSYGLPCPGEKRSGIEQVAHDLANALSDRGHAVTVFTYDRQPPDARYATRPLPCRRFVMTRMGRALTMGYVGNLLALAPDYREFDVIVAHGDSLLLPLKGKPIVRIMHGTAIEEARSATSVSRKLLQSGVYGQELLAAWLQRGTVAVSANTRRLNPFIRRMIPNGIDLERFRMDAGIRSAHPSVLFVGTLTGRKRGAWLLEQFEQHIRPMVPAAELHMVTTPGPRRAGVTYHTGIAAAEMARLYQYAWIYASPSRYEGFGLPYVEALASGTPIVATPNPGSREVLDNGRFGILVGDDAFARNVVRLLTDENERRRLAHAGLRRATAYDITIAAASYEALIDEMVA
jgi:glycosyltransferase involved in cell wall biosynthesis